MRPKFFILVLFITINTFGYARADVDLSGRVVERNSSDGVRDVRIELRYSRDDKVRDSDTTDSNGSYSLKASDEAVHFFITYKPDDTNEYSTNGRSWVSNDADPKSLDTVGLVRFENRNRNRGDAGASAEGASNYSDAGGDSETARRSLDAAIQFFGRSEMREDMVRIPWLEEALNRKGLGF